jgi:Flp pilus assembly protein TadD
MRHYETAVRLQPDSGKAEANLGNALLVAGRAQEAIPHLERAVTLEPDLAAAHEFLGDALDVVGRRVDAVRRYDEALALAPSDPTLQEKRRRLAP